MDTFDIIETNDDDEMGEDHEIQSFMDSPNFVYYFFGFFLLICLLTCLVLCCILLILSLREYQQRRSFRIRLRSLKAMTAELSSNITSGQEEASVETTL